MSYAVMGSKNGQLMVESVGAGQGPADQACLAFQTQWGATWVPGNLMMSPLHLTFMPSRASSGAGMLKLKTSDITGVELGNGMRTKPIGLRIGGHVLRFKCAGADKLAQQLAQAANDARRRGGSPVSVRH
ncbi:hypothetical protein [Nocardioides sp. GY 10127]|uniref:hypothetical protein n=1 Tax=Nocardioides sp. GY 10127 TaxID=2569762 RepID=UPI0010A874F0|nr:hypothetical protein [Nocardioides sp. GY 10127]TIC82739.1 hypothetical protein E8D37_08600 [Nocardioides sp. GY 10127]